MTDVARAVVFAGGEPPPAAVVRASCARGDAFVVAADSGLDHALALGLAVDLVVGDLDSVSTDALASARAAGVPVDEHPAAKDATDLELAMLAARARGARRITVVGGGGGRHDHLIANALVLAADAFADVAVDALVGTALLTVVRSDAALCGRPGSLLSLLAVGGPALGVRTQGLRYPLADEELVPGSTRGVSNELLDSEATVTVERGVVLAVQPHAFEEV